MRQFCHAAREELAFFKGVKVILTKKDLSAQKKTDEQCDLAIRQIISSSTTRFISEPSSAQGASGPS